MINRKRKDADLQASAFLSHYPQWMDMAAGLLFSRDAKNTSGTYNLQYAVAQGLLAAHKMGWEGRSPPMPEGVRPRLREPDPPDEETDAILYEMTMLAWSPLAGTPRPEGYAQWRMDRYYAEQERKKGAAKVLPRTRTRAASPTVAPVLIRRRK